MAMKMIHAPTCKDHNPDQEKKVLLLSRLTERSSKFQTSSLENKVCKANSDLLDNIYIKPNKKSKKSVLTLPNEPNRIPPYGTVSDCDDSQYIKKEDEQKSRRNKCLLPVRYNKSTNQRMTKKDDQVVLCKSTGYKGDEKKISCTSGSHDVWAILRNMNRFHFQPSPPMSDHSFMCVKKNKNLKTNLNTRIFETCHTEEIEYTLTSYDLETSLPKSKTGSIRVGHDTSMDDIFSCKFFKYNTSFNNKRTAKLIDVNKNIKAAPVCKLVSYENRQILIDVKNNDQGDVLVDHNQSTETLKNKTVSSNATLTQSVIRQRSIGSATSSKFYSNIEKRRNNINKNFNHNAIASNKRKKNTPIDKRIILHKKGNNAVAKSNKNNERLMSYYKSNNIKRNQDQRSLIYKVDHLPHKGDPSTCNCISSISPQVEVKRPSKVNLTRDSTKSFFDTYKGRLAQASSVTFNEKNLTKCSDKVNINYVKRKLANMKFPIVITGRDQINPVRLQYNDIFCQFSGVDTQIWPFMVQWTNRKTIKCKERKYRPLSNIASEISETEYFKLNKKKIVGKEENKRYTKAEQIMSLKTDDRNTPKQNLKTTSNSDYKYKQKSFNIIPKIENVRFFVDQSKTNNFDIYKNKMQRLLRKKSTNTVATITPNSEQIENICSEQDFRRPMNKIIINPKRNKNVINVGFENKLYSRTKTISGQIVFRKDKSTDSIQSLSKNKYSKPLNKQMWAKAKWANDVIDNVLKKLNDGLYYIQHTQHISRFEKENDVVIPIIREIDVTPKSSKIIISRIPGFDVPLPTLEIESLSMKEIAIKQPMTNLTIRFDVIIPSSKLQITTGTVFECSPSEVVRLPDTIQSKTPILNTVLPAELCSVIPQIMHKFSEKRVQCSLLPVKNTKIEPQLATITELVNRRDSVILTNLRSLALSTTMVKMFNCTSAFKLKLPIDAKSKIPRGHCSFSDVTWIKDFISKTKNHIPCIIEIPFIIHLKKHFLVPTMKFEENYFSNELLTKNCKYTNCTTVSTIWKFYTIEILKLFSQYRDTQKPQFIIENADLATIACKINYNIRNNIILNLEIIGVLSSPRNHVIKKKQCPLYTEKQGPDVKANNNFFLCKIKNIEDFLQIIGAGLAKSNVFDEIFEKKIMLCILKMRKWLDKIDIKQAMLIMLFANRCDTQDIFKFGTKLLEYVAQNVITNTSQLEKEIVAIKHRKLLNADRKASSPLKEKGDLYQECYRIAKSAAKHSHGTFDENAEIKLKMFLEKRRQLNPSFLRAMATFLGLGLLTIDSKTN